MEEKRGWVATSLGLSACERTTCNVLQCSARRRNSVFSKTQKPRCNRIDQELMPQIEELQTTAKAAAPGWSYIVDTGFDPSKAAINPTSRKRQRTGGADAGNASDLTLRQQTAIQRHLAELDKDNHKSELVNVPHIESKKQTTNVRRILGSGKTFAHYVQDEEAFLAQSGGVTTNTETNTASTTRASKTPIARRKSVLIREPSSSESSPAPTTPVAAATAVQTRTGSISAQTPASKSVKEVEPWNVSILSTTQPLTISEDEIEALLAAPALPYNAVKSAPPPASAPRQRVFCEICGYWGRAKCMKCGARVCGVECRNAHDESRCLKFYA